MEGLLARRRVLIAGGSAGIGLAVARQAQRNGAEVMVASRRAPDRLAALGDDELSRIKAYAVDVTSQNDLKQVFDAVGQIDHVAVTVRAELDSVPFEVTEIEQAKQAFDTKLWGSYRLIQIACDHLGKAGSITLTSGLAGAKIYPGASTMALINSATETLVRSLAVELAPIRVNAVSPGFVAPKPNAVRDYADQFPVPRLATPDEIASAYVWIMSNQYVTGTVLPIDGGALLV